MNKTIYLRDEEGPIWERARELAGDKLSPVIVVALKRFIADKESIPKGFERIEVPFHDFDDHDIPKVKAFYGRWIFPPLKPIEQFDDFATYFYAVAITGKGAAVIFSWIESDEHRRRYQFQVYPSLGEAAAHQEVNYAARRAIEAIGVPVEELDI
jgi:hypothetical protein